MESQLPVRSGPLVAARDVGRHVPDGTGWLFRGIDLDLGCGERVGLAGPTGSGKSLVLRAIALLDPLDEGEVLWLGSSVPDGEVPTYRSKVVYVQQRSPLGEGTVEDNLRLGYQLRRRRSAPLPRERLVSLVEEAGREASFLSRRTEHLSGGERQTVALMRALLIDPALLLLDEPTAALDNAATETLERLLTNWLAADMNQRAFVWVSHDPSQLERMVDRVVGLREGRMAAS